MPTYDDVDDGVFELKSYGKYVFSLKVTWNAGQRNGIIIFYERTDTVELTKDSFIGSKASPDVIERIIDVIKRYWDCFCVKGCHRTIIGYEFSIDTGDHTLACCKKHLMVSMSLRLS